MFPKLKVCQAGDVMQYRVCLLCFFMLWVFYPLVSKHFFSLWGLVATIKSCWYSCILLSSVYVIHVVSVNMLHLTSFLWVSHWFYKSSMNRTTHSFSFQMLKRPLQRHWLPFSTRVLRMKKHININPDTYLTLKHESQWDVSNTEQQVHWSVANIMFRHACFVCCKY